MQPRTVFRVYNGAENEVDESDPILGHYCLANLEPELSEPVFTLYLLCGFLGTHKKNMSNTLQECCKMQL